MARPSFALDFGAAHIACGAFSAEGGRLRLERWTAAEIPSDPAGDALWTAQAAQALASAASRDPLTGPTALAIPGHLALTKFIKTPAIAPAKRGRVLQFEAAQAIPYPLEEVVWDHHVVADDGLDLELLLTAAKVDVVGELCAAAAAAGLEVEQVLAGCLALRAGFRFNHPEVRDPVLLVDVGARSTHLVFLDGERFFVRTLTQAGNTITQAIAEELQLDFAAAEKLKREVLGGASHLAADAPIRAAVLRAAEFFGTRLQLEITRSIVSVRRQTEAAAPSALWLTGGAAQAAALPGLLSAGLKLPVERYDPLRRVDVAAAASGARAAAATLGVLVGLAVPPARGVARVAGLVPREVGARLAFRRQQPWWLAAAALAVAALVPPLVHFHRVAQQATAQIAAYDAQLRPIRAVQNRMAENLDQLDAAEKEIAALHGLAADRSNWIAFLADLQTRLAGVEDVWLEQLAVVRAPNAPRAPAPDDAAKPAPLRLTLSGRLLDKKHPVSKVSADSYARVTHLLESFAASPFIADVDNERFDNSQPGILRFDFTLVVKPDHPL